MTLRCGSRIGGEALSIESDLPCKRLYSLLEAFKRKELLVGNDL
jgi:hypothetical protein